MAHNTAIWLLAVIVLASVAVSCHATVVLSLNGENWKARNQNGSIDVAAEVPGSIYTDLHRAGVLGSEDFYYRFNDLTFRWVAYDNWTYTTQFTVSSDLLSHVVVELVADGLDTVAELTLNGVNIGSTHNMFRQYIWDVKQHLKEGANILIVQFTSPLHYGASQAKAYPYTVPPECRPPVEKGLCHRNFVRKEACSSGWDWGPAFPTMGIWKDLYLQAYNTAVIRSIKVKPQKDSKGWSLNTTVCVAMAAGTSHVTIDLILPHFTSQKYTVNRVEAQETCSHLNMSIPYEQDIELWWPNGYGAQPLYELQVIVISSGEQTSTFRRFGFRTVELVQEPIKNSQGLSFYFKINDFPVYMKGSNWIPADSFQERITEDYLRLLLGSAAEANINMLRVWGGGVYESDTFYNLADELGIMIWQDFMFACAMYPTDHDFLDNVRKEVIYQVRRLNHHPSIAIWAGNNENEAALATNWYNTTGNYKLYHTDYVALYISTIMKSVVEEDTGLPYVSSSPTNGKDSQKEGWVAKDPYSEFFGDLHSYLYNVDSWNWTSFETPRFASEYGIQAWPSFESLKTVSVPEDWDFNSSFVDHRQHHGGTNGQSGNQEMLNEIAMNLKIPIHQDATVWFTYYIYLTQVNQAMSMKTESEHYRRSQYGLWGGKGMTMGALYWQLNDIWQAPTWASMEYGGKWKMLHYYVKNFFSDVLVSPYLNGSTVMVYYMEDQKPNKMIHEKEQMLNYKMMNLDNQVIKMSSGAEDALNIQCYSWDSLSVRKEWTVPFDKPSSGGGLIYQRDIDDMLKEAGCDSRDHCMLYFTSSGAPHNWLFPAKLKNAIGMKEVTILVKSVAQVNENKYIIELSTDGIAAFVWLEATGIPGHFSHNGFMMVSAEKQVQFISQQPIKQINILQDALVVMSLSDVYRVR